MLHPEFALLLLTWIDGRSRASVLADQLGLSQRRCRDPLSQRSKASIARTQTKKLQKIKADLKDIGWSATQIDDWLSQHPGLKGSFRFYSTLVYECESPSAIKYPRTREFASQVDALVLSLEEQRANDDLAGYKEALLTTGLLRQMFIPQRDHADSCKDMPEFLRKVRAASSWDELIAPLRVASANLLLSFLAKWDVEFGTQVYFPKLKPRSVFALVMPRLHPATQRVDGELKTRRDMFWYPVRRLIDFMACIAVRKERGWELGGIPKVRDVAFATGTYERNLVNWRDGTKKFKRTDFVGLWRGLFSGNHRGSEIHQPPWPLFIATLCWQHLLTSVDTNSGERTIKPHEEEYLQLWQREFDELSAEGASFGEAPWRECFSQL